MAIVGFNFTKITAERKSVPKGSITITNNVNIKEAKKANINLGDSKQDGIKFDFEMSIKYEPEIGEISFKGDFLYMETPEKVSKIMDSWKKDKKIPEELKLVFLTQILHKSLVEAVLVSRDINLPPPIKIGALKPGAKGTINRPSQYIG